MKSQTQYGQRSEAITHDWLNSRPSTIQPISSASTRTWRLCADPSSSFCSSGGFASAVLAQSSMELKNVRIADGVGYSADHDRQHHGGLRDHCRARGRTDLPD